uniref:Dolichyl-P-Glc:Glc(2)Man(9)GlcNAc(2)-PP-dolichol alpha-1,2-glucosyltransferase n=1 Tax=Gongylonema pulchrum TaxID=637853 RepID=A0A183DLE0_9BILA
LPFCDKYKEDFGRILLITGLRLTDFLCALPFAFCAVHRVSIATIPILITAVLLLTPLPSVIKDTLCLLMSYYISLLTISRLSFNAFRGFIDYPDVCTFPHVTEWLFWIGLVSDDSNPALVCYF